MAFPFSIWKRILVKNINQLKRRGKVVKNYILVFTLIILSSVSFSQTQLKLGYIDSEVILTQFSEAIKAQGDLDALTNKYSAQLDSMTLAYQQAIADYQKQAETMTDAKKTEFQQKIVMMEQNLVDFRRAKFTQGTGEIFKKQEELFAPIKVKIYAAIEKVAKEENMQFVFDKSGDIILLYADSAFDITFKVLDRLRRGN
ncbi:MAG: Outer membrane protein (OmpH-like) [Ignavibacteria bacterium ADurb.Bin266]|jgi:outer membrane protein|nr:MAG: Outer membrane protein (OmpH-like) [Ignavibacteria bacterium ADurb.Bin266]